MFADEGDMSAFSKPYEIVLFAGSLIPLADFIDPFMIQRKGVVEKIDVLNGGVPFQSLP